MPCNSSINRTTISDYDALKRAADSLKIVLTREHGDGYDEVRDGEMLLLARYDAPLAYNATPEAREKLESSGLLQAYGEQVAIAYASEQGWLYAGKIDGEMIFN